MSRSSAAVVNLQYGPEFEDELEDELDELDELEELDELDESSRRLFS